MTSLIDILKNLPMVSKAIGASFAICTGIAVSTVGYFHSDLRASESRVMTKQEIEVGRIHQRLDKLEENSEFIKRCMMQKCWEK